MATQVRRGEDVEAKATDGRGTDRTWAEAGKWARQQETATAPPVPNPTAIINGTNNMSKADDETLATRLRLEKGSKRILG